MICDTFKFLAEFTWKKIELSRKTKFQLGEETITDLLILYLKHNHPKNIYARTFTKKREGKNGTDFEFWIKDSSKKWLCIRLQAKIIGIKNDDFKHIHYKTNSKKQYQCDLLIKNSINATYPKFPLYCLYGSWDTRLYKNPLCSSTLNKNELFGCSILSPFELINFRKNGKKTSLKDLLPKMQPWHYLFCPKNNIISNYETMKTNNYLKKQFPILLNSVSDTILNIPDSFILSNAPDYVKKTIESDFSQDDDTPPDAQLRSVIVYSAIE